MEMISNKPKHEEIAVLAYEIWQKGGCKPKTDLENWLKAEKQLCAAKQTATRTSRLAPEYATELSNGRKNHLRRPVNAPSNQLQHT